MYTCFLRSSKLMIQCQSLALAPFIRALKRFKTTSCVAIFLCLFCKACAFYLPFLPFVPHLLPLLLVCPPFMGEPPLSLPFVDVHDLLPLPLFVNHCALPVPFPLPLPLLHDGAPGAHPGVHSFVFCIVPCTILAIVISFYFCLCLCLFLVFVCLFLFLHLFDLFCL